MKRFVYIIEDDAVIMHGLAAKFSSLGFKTTTNNGSGDLSSLSLELIRSKPDLIILDLTLPAMDGFEVLGMIKSDNHLSRTPVFIFSNLIDSDVRLRSERMGAEHFFKKSELNVDTFVDKVIKIFKNRERVT